MNSFDQIFNQLISGYTNPRVKVEPLLTAPTTNELPNGCYMKIVDKVTFYMTMTASGYIVSFVIGQLLQSVELTYRLRHILRQYHLTDVDMPPNVFALLNEEAFSKIVECVSRCRTDDIGKIRLVGIKHSKCITDRPILEDNFSPGQVKSFGFLLCRHYDGGKFEYVSTVLRDSLPELMDAGLGKHIIGYSYMPFVLLSDGLLFDGFVPEVAMRTDGPSHFIDERIREFTTPFTNFIHKQLIDMDASNLSTVLLNVVKDLYPKALLTELCEYDKSSYGFYGHKKLFDLVISIDNKTNTVKKISSIDKYSVKSIGIKSKHRLSHDRHSYRLIIDIDSTMNKILYSLVKN